MYVTSARSKGRPRNEVTRHAVLHAALELAGKRGYSNVTVQDIALRAGTTRQTIYRWWQALADVYMEALSDQVHAISTPSFFTDNAETSTHDA
jgi:AcrR family transcriptional regulator